MVSLEGSPILYCGSLGVGIFLGTDHVYLRVVLEMLMHS